MMISEPKTCLFMSRPAQGTLVDTFTGELCYRPGDLIEVPCLGKRCTATYKQKNEWICTLVDLVVEVEEP